MYHIDFYLKIDPNHITNTFTKKHNFLSGEQDIVTIVISYEHIYKKIHHLFNKSKKLFFVYNSDRKIYIVCMYSFWLCIHTIMSSRTTTQYNKLNS